MFFTAPIVLLGLIPWAGLVTWVMLGQARQAGVPWLALWDRNEPTARPERTFRRPPAGTMLLLLSALLALLAAAGPARRDAHAIGTIDVVIDRGAGRAALDDGVRRFNELVANRSGTARVRFVPYTPPLVVRVDQVAGAVASVRLTNEPTARELVETLKHREPVSGEEADGTNEVRGEDAARVVVVLTDRAPHESLSNGDKTDTRENTVAPDAFSFPLAVSRRMILLAPARQRGNIALEHVGVRPTERGAARVLLRVRNDGFSLRSATVTVTTSDTATRHPIDLPADGATRDLILNRVAIGPWIEVRLDAPGGWADDDDRDDVAYTARTATWPAVEARTALPAGVTRAIETYTRVRPPGRDAYYVGIAQRHAPDGSPRPGLVFALPTSEAPRPDAQAGFGAFEIDPAMAFTRDVDWPRVAREAHWIAPLPPGWQPVVAVAGRTLVATRGDGESRQVWIGADVERWAERADWVVFFAAAVDWAGDGGNEYATASPAVLEPDIWQRIAPPVPPAEEAAAGIYRRQDGAFRAIAVTPTSRRSTTSPAFSPIDLIAPAMVDLSPWAAATGLILLIAGVFWMTRQPWNRRTTGQGSIDLTTRERP